MVSPGTKFKDRASGNDGPVSGAFSIISFCFDTGLASTTYEHSIDLPAGMKFEIESIDVRAKTIGATPSLTVGSTKGGAERVAAVNVTATLGPLTIIAGQNAVAAGGIVSVAIVNAAGDTYDNVTVTIYGFVSAFPDSIAVRSANHF